MFSSSRTWCLVIPLSLVVPTRVSAQDDELQAKINRAIDRGVKNLKQIGGESGVWGHTYTPGMTALAAWTLIESGVEPNHEIVQKAAAYLRKEGIKLINTYSLALTILFFDRLGDPGDEALIQALGVRLLAGQKTNGSWTYNSDWGNQADRDWLGGQLEEADKQRRDKTAPKTGTKTLLPQIKKQLDKLDLTPRDGTLGGDNSNTQFAMLALWVARRHGLPVVDAIEKVEKRFRRSQINGKGWAYSPEINPGSPPRATMTCAGLLGLALGEGMKPKKQGQGEKLKKDPLVKGALGLLGDFLNNPDPEKDKILLEKPGMFNYFLFSMERMAVVYDVKTIGGKDWYTWGAKILVERQNDDGSWRGDYAAAETCFALLFLKRANVAEDLTFNLNPILKPPRKKKLKENEREKDPFDLPREKEKKKIRPKDKESGFLAPLIVPELGIGNAFPETPFPERNWGNYFGQRHRSFLEMRSGVWERGPEG